MIAVISELKAVFFEVIFVIVFALVNSKATPKRILKYTAIIVASIGGLSIAAKQLARLYPEFEKYWSFSGLMQAVTNEQGYGSTGYIDPGFPNHHTSISGIVYVRGKMNLPHQEKSA